MLLSELFTDATIRIRIQWQSTIQRSAIGHFPTKECCWPIKSVIGRPFLLIIFFITVFFSNIAISLPLKHQRYTIAISILTIEGSSRCACVS